MLRWLALDEEEACSLNSTLPPTLWPAPAISTSQLQGKSSFSCPLCLFSFSHPPCFLHLYKFFSPLHYFLFPSLPLSPPSFLTFPGFFSPPPLLCLYFTPPFFPHFSLSFPFLFALYRSLFLFHYSSFPPNPFYLFAPFVTPPLSLYFFFSLMISTFLLYRFNSPYYPSLLPPPISFLNFTFACLKTLYLVFHLSLLFSQLNKLLVIMISYIMLISSLHLQFILCCLSPRNIFDFFSRVILEFKLSTFFSTKEFILF